MSQEENAGEEKGRAVLLTRCAEFRYDDEKHDIPLGQVVVIKTGDESWFLGDIHRTNFFGDHFDDPTFKGTVIHERVYTGKGGEFVDGERTQEVCVGFKGELKMIVVGHSRDCDGTPLYILSFKPVGYPCQKYTKYDKELKETFYPVEGRSSLQMSFKYQQWMGLLVSGIGVDSLTVCVDEFIPLTHEDIYAYEDHMREEMSQ